METEKRDLRQEGRLREEIQKSRKRKRRPLGTGGLLVGLGGAALLFGAVLFFFCAGRGCGLTKERSGGGVSPGGPVSARERPGTAGERKGMAGEGQDIAGERQSLAGGAGVPDPSDGTDDDRRRTSAYVDEDGSDPGAGAGLGKSRGQEDYAAYQAYQERFERVAHQSQIQEAGFSVIQEQIFPLETECFGSVTMIPALDKEHHRLALFFAGPNGEICYRTERLETNIRRMGCLDQCNEGIAAVSFQDVDEDGLTDILLITLCSNGSAGRGRERAAGAEAKSEPPSGTSKPLTEEGAEEELPSGTEDKMYKVGDVLFQGKDGFYRDWRLSDKLNRFSMNKSVRFILSFVKEGLSTEFLYTAATLKELQEGGLAIDEARRSWQEFEKLGRLEVIPGVYRMAEYNILMIYLVDERGDIVWSFQPMGDHENLYELLGVRCRDLDGDGLKDLAVLARYGYETDAGQMVTEKDYWIYCQRTGGFLTDTEMRSWYPCVEETDMETLTEQAGLYWGWSG